MAARELNGDDPLLDSAVAFLPCRAPGASGPTSVIAQERHRAHRAVRRLLDMLGQGEAARARLHHLHLGRSGVDPARSARSGGATSTGPRCSGARPALGAGLGSPRAALSGSEVTLLELTRLTQGQSAEPLGGSVEGADLGTTCARTGQSVFALQLARAAALPGAGDGERAGGAVGGVPAGVADALLSRARGPERTGAAPIDAAATAGDPFELDLAQRVAELDPAAAMDALDERLEVGLLVETDVPRRFGSRHPRSGARRPRIRRAPAGG